MGEMWKLQFQKLSKKVKLTDPKPSAIPQNHSVPPETTHSQSDSNKNKQL